MACTNGYRKKSGVSNYEFLVVADSVCALWGDNSPICKLARFGLGNLIPNSLIDVNSFCSSGPPAVASSLNFTDLIGGSADKVIDAAKRAKFSTWCECIPSTSPPGQSICWEILHTDCAGSQQVSYMCGDTCEVVPSPASCSGQFNGVIWLINGQEIMSPSSYTQQTISVSPNGDPSNPPPGRSIAINSCGNCVPQGEVPPSPPEPSFPTGFPEIPPAGTGSGDGCGCSGTGGEQGPPGPPGEPGEDMAIEFEDLILQVPACQNGVEGTEEITVQVIKGTGGSTKALYELLLNYTFTNLPKEPCAEPALLKTDSNLEGIKTVSIVEGASFVELDVIEISRAVGTLVTNDESEPSRLVRGGFVAFKTAGGSFTGSDSVVFQASSYMIPEFKDVVGFQVFLPPGSVYTVTQYGR